MGSSGPGRGATTDQPVAGVPTPSGATVTEQARRLNFGIATRAGPPIHILLIDRRRLADPATAIAGLPPGSAVILRDYADPARGPRARRLLRLCRAARVRFLVAGDPRLAARIGADGVHLPEAMAGQALAWRRLKPGWLMTTAAHSRAALFRAAAWGADAALLSPVFATASHPGQATLGPLRFAALARHAALPVYALGGISATNLRRLKNAGAVGVAGISGYDRAKR